MAKKSATQEALELLTNEPVVEQPDSIIDNVFQRPALSNDPVIATATGNSNILEGLREIKSVGQIEFTRKNREQQKNSNKYFYGLLPIVGRKTVHVCGNVTLAMFSGTPMESNENVTTIIRNIGSIGTLDDDQVLEAINKIKKIGLRFYRTIHSETSRTPDIFKIQEDNPSEHYWAHGEYPLGQFCFFESVAQLNKLYGNESGWRSKNVPMRSLIARLPIPSGFLGTPTLEMGDGWTGYWPVKKKEEVSEELFELSDNLIALSGFSR